MQVPHGLVATAEGPKAIRQAQLRAHIRPGFECKPKVARQLLEGFLSQGTFASGQSHLQMTKCLLAVSRIFRQKYVGIGAVSANGQSLVGKLSYLVVVTLVEGPVNQFLRFT